MHDLTEGEARVAVRAEREGDGAEVHDAGDVLGVDDADDVFRAAVGIVDGNAGVLLVDDAGGGLFDGEVGWKREDLAAGCHDLADGDLVELDGAVDDLFLEGGQQAHATSGGGDELKSSGEWTAPSPRRGARKSLRTTVAEELMQLDGRTGDADEDVHGAGNGECDAFGALKGERLGDELAEEDLEVSDDGKGEDNGDGVDVQDDVVWESGEERGGDAEQERGDGGFADPAEGKAGEGDAELDGGEELVDGVLELVDGACAGTAEGDELLDAGLADADEGELRSYEEAVGQDEEGHCDGAEEHPLHEDSVKGGGICGDGWLRSRLVGSIAG